MAESEARWYVVHTYSGYENKVATDLMTTAENRNLQDMIIDVKVPVEIVTETVGDKTKEVENKLFPGYVFVKMVYTDETWYVVRNIRGCTGFVGPGSKPVPLTDAEVYRMGVETYRSTNTPKPLRKNNKVTSTIPTCMTSAITSTCPNGA